MKKDLYQETFIKKILIEIQVMNKGYEKKISSLSKMKKST